MDDSIRDILRNCRILKHIPPAALDRLASQARLLTFARGQIIVRQGDPCPGFFAVASGAVRVYKLNPTGKEHVLHFVHAGGTFAEVAVIAGFDCPAFASALEETRCVLVPADVFRRLLDTDHAFCLGMMRGLSFWVRELVGLLEDLVLRDAVARVAGHLLRQSNADSSRPFTLAVAKKELAAHLNLTSETLSRTLRRIEDAGLIELIGPQKIRIVDRARLAELAAGLPAGEFS